MKKNSRRLWIVAAGTGGHIIPGLALAQELRVQKPDVELTFFGSKDRLEEKLVPKHGYTLLTIDAKPLKGKSLWDQILSLFSVIKSLFTIWSHLSRERPVALISVGGYVAVSVGLCCWLRRVPIFLIEPNIRAGIANRFLSRLAELAFSVRGSDAFKKFHCPVEETGNPVLGSFLRNPIRREAKNLVILGGSQGARALCSVGLNAIRRLLNRGLDLKLFLQSGEKNLEDSLELKKSLKLGDECEIKSFIDDMPRRLEWADVVVARAGAMTLTELSLCQVPCILVPFPHAADDHQRVNAQLWADSGAARIVDEKEKDFEKRLEDEIFEMVAAPGSYERRSLMSEKLQLYARPKAAEKIASKIFETLGVLEPKAQVV